MICMLLFFHSVVYVTKNSNVDICMSGLDSLSKLTGLMRVVRGKTLQVNSSDPLFIYIVMSH
jgi:hypothetical protein